MLAVILSAAALTAPALSSSIGDYPQDAVKAEVSAAALVRVVVNPNGKAVSCETLQRFGDEKLSLRMCPIILRGRHKPAHLRDGTTTWGQVTMLYRLFIPGTAQGAKMAALQEAPVGPLKIDHLPGGAATAEVKIVLALDAHGQVSDCGPGHEEKQTSLVSALCASPAALTRKPLVAPSGEAVAYVTDLRLALLAAPSAGP